MANKRLLLVTSCAVGLFATVGAALPYPILPPLFADGQINAFNSFAGLPPKFLLGLALAINPLGILIGSAILGPFSDRHGRRATLLMTLLGNAIGHLATMWALYTGHYLLFLLARFVTGLTEGNASIMRALLADELEGDERLRAFAWFNGASFSGWLIGPLIAGATVQFGASVPFLLAAVVLFLTYLMGVVAIPHHPPTHTSTSIWRHMNDHHAFALLKHQALRDLFIINFTYTVGVTAFYEFFPLWLVEFGKFQAGGISIISAALCGVMTGMSAVVGRGWFKTSDTRHLRMYMMFAGACIGLTALLGSVWGCVALIAFGAPHALYNASLLPYCSERFHDFGQGAIMGMISTSFCVANVAVAVIGSVVTLIDTRLVLLLGAAASIGAGWRIARWAAQTAIVEKRVTV